MQFVSSFLKPVLYFYYTTLYKLHTPTPLTNKTKIVDFPEWHIYTQKKNKSKKNKKMSIYIPRYSWLNYIVRSHPIFFLMLFSSCNQDAI